MGLLSLLVTWPFAPIRGVIKLGELLQEQVDRELHDPAVIRRRLEEVEKARAEGRISAREEAEAVERILGRITGRIGRGRTSERGDSGA